MLKISVVPDTNIFINYPEFFQCLLNEDFKILLPICVSTTVIHELDGLKNENLHTRKIINFIFENKKINKIEIEGNINETLIEVEYPRGEFFKPENNDDKILNYATTLENPVLITQDKNLSLKCYSRNIKCIVPSGSTTFDIYNDLLFFLGDIQEFANIDTITIKIERLTEKLYGIVNEILYKEISDIASLYIPPKNILDLCRFILDNFFIFKKYLPVHSKKLISNFIFAYRKADVKKINLLFPQITSLFRINFN